MPNDGYSYMLANRVGSKSTRHGQRITLSSSLGTDRLQILEEGHSDFGQMIIENLWNYQSRMYLLTSIQTGLWISACISEKCDRYTRIGVMQVCTHQKADLTTCECHKYERRYEIRGLVL